MPSFAGVVPLPSDVEYRCYSGVAACEGVDVVCASCVSARASICVFLHLCARVCMRDHACVVCIYLNVVARTRESETSDVTVTLRERVPIRHVGMFRIVVDSSHPNTPHNTTHASNESLASTRAKSNSTRAIVATQETARDRSGGNQRRYRIRVWHIRCFPRCKYLQGHEDTKSILSISDRRPAALGRKIFHMLWVDCASLRPGIAHTAVCEALHRVRLSPSLCSPLSR